MQYCHTTITAPSQYYTVPCNTHGRACHAAWPNVWGWHGAKKYVKRGVIKGVIKPKSRGYSVVKPKSIRPGRRAICKSVAQGHHRAVIGSAVILLWAVSTRLPRRSRPRGTVSRMCPDRPNVVVGVYTAPIERLCGSCPFSVLARRVLEFDRSSARKCGWSIGSWRGTTFLISANAVHMIDSTRLCIDLQRSL